MTSSLPAFLAPVIQTLAADDGGAAQLSVTATVASFQMACQEETQWCWAAVTQAVERLSSSSFSQSEIASRHIDPTGGGLVCVHPLIANPPQGALCHTCHAGCSSPHSLGKILGERGRLAGDPLAGPPSFDEIVAAISTDLRPLPVRISWPGDSGHFICVTGYSVDAAGVRRVTVVDPLHPNIGAAVADAQDLRFETFLEAYPAGDGTSGKPNFRYRIN